MLVCCLFFLSLQNMFNMNKNEANILSVSQSRSHRESRSSCSVPPRCLPGVRGEIWACYALFNITCRRHSHKRKLETYDNKSLVWNVALGVAWKQVCRLNVLLSVEYLKVCAETNRFSQEKKPLKSLKSNSFLSSLLKCILEHWIIKQQALIIKVSSPTHITAGIPDIMSKC